MSKAILNWLLELREDSELRRLAKIAGVSVPGFRTTNAPRSNIIQNLINSNKSVPLIKALNQEMTDTGRYLGKTMEELENLALRYHNEIPLVFIALLGSNEAKDHEQLEPLFEKFKEEGILQIYEDYHAKLKEQKEKETHLEKAIQEFEQKAQSDAKRIRNIEEKLARVTKNLEDLTEKHKKEKEEAQKEKQTLLKEKQSLIQENHELKKQKENLTHQIAEMEGVHQALEEKVLQLDAQVKELTVKSDHYEALIKEVKNPSAQNSTEDKASLPQQKVALVGSTVTKRLLGKSLKAQFVSEGDALNESIINEYDQVILATFDLHITTKKRIAEIVKDKVILCEDPLHLRRYLKQEA